MPPLVLFYSAGGAFSLLGLVLLLFCSAGGSFSPSFLLARPAMAWQSRPPPPPPARRRSRSPVREPQRQEDDAQWLIDSKWEWCHNGRDKTGVIEFLDKGKLRTDMGNQSGCWRIDDKRYVVVTFGRYHHTLRFSHNAFEVIERKMRDGRDSRMALFVTRGFLLQPAIGARQ